MSDKSSIIDKRLLGFPCRGILTLPHGRDRGKGGVGTDAPVSVPTYERRSRPLRTGTGHNFAERITDMGRNKRSPSSQINCAEKMFFRQGNPEVTDSMSGATGGFQLNNEKIISNIQDSPDLVIAVYIR